MHHFDYKNGQLFAEDVNLFQLAEEVGTPFYCYSKRTFERHYRIFSEAFAGQDHLICYAMKANSNQAILNVLARQGAGMDVVSYGELLRARAAGVPGERILFSGVGKTKEEMSLALDMGILCFNVESEPELERLDQVAQSKNMQAPVSLRINPDVDARTHEKISTGKKADKFGIAWEEARRIYNRAAQMPGIRVSGIDMHIGSQITQLTPFKDAFALLKELVEDLREDGHVIEHVDLGGGLGIPYDMSEDAPPKPDDYANLVRELVGELNVKLIFEPGRLIAGNAGILVSRVEYIKHSNERLFVIVDAGMNDLIRPTLYEAHHEILPLRELDDGVQLVRSDIVGPVCESGDYLVKERFVPPFKQGDLFAVMSAGAYGATQSSTYNSRLLIPEVLVDGDQYALIRPRLSHEALIHLDRVPDWARNPAAGGA